MAKGSGKAAEAVPDGPWVHGTAAEAVPDGPWLHGTAAEAVPSGTASEVVPRVYP